MIFCEKEESSAKIKKELLLHENFKNGNIKIRFVSPSDPTTDPNLLVKIKILFQKQLSKMPRGYILRQVFDKKHTNLVLLNSFDNIIGAICYRPFYHKYFIEIVFCAVDQNYQVKGIGSFMMDVLKENIKTETVQYHKLYKETFRREYDKFDIQNGMKICNNESEQPKLYKETFRREYDKFDIQNGIKISNNESEQPVLDKEKDVYDVLGIIPNKNKSIDTLPAISQNEKLFENVYLITYADNSAIGYFRKQGFKKEISFTDWIGHIKDYEGGTIMQCKVFWDINYIYKFDSIRKKKDDLLTILENEHGYNKTYEISDYSSIRTYLDIPGADNTMNMGNDMRNRNNCLNGFIDLLISELVNDPSSWPFLEPVNTKDVPEYYDVIKNPTDLSKISKKFLEGKYKDLDLFISDIHLMLNNCYKFNSRETEYYKCALRLNDKLEEKLKAYEMSIRKWRLKE
ncbi:Histone acetyltransferase GCN5 [Nosema granulosis]|uniref:Histone acetyltransferase GCN5 n=1 Tax=Nosema granulosis TaxID=83296 RepID=A0A9P6KZC8_9MICR|nr:Histone acetyltransferase GCN5 [Nosema granulosis]